MRNCKILAFGVLLLTTLIACHESPGTTFKQAVAHSKIKSAAGVPKRQHGVVYPVMQVTSQWKSPCKTKRLYLPVDSALNVALINQQICLSSFGRGGQRSKLSIPTISRLALPGDKVVSDSLCRFDGYVDLRFPDIGCCQCYYSSRALIEQKNMPDEDRMRCYTSGNLILVDTLKQVAKALTIYFSASASFAGYDRLFLLEKPGAIQIFDWMTGESEAILQRKTMVVIKSNGSVKIYPARIKDTD